MSYRSYTTYDCTVPDTTKINGEFKTYNAWAFASFTHNRDRGTYEIHFDGETKWTEDVLMDLIELFQMPLDEVPGLELHCHYETDEDGHWECELHIVDGKCTYSESEIRLVEQPIDYCSIRFRP